MNMNLVLFVVAALTVAASSTSIELTGKVNRDKEIKIKYDGPLGITGGESISIKKVKHTGAVLYDASELTGSAVIIDKKWALTAAYSVLGYETESIKIRVGSSNYKSGGHLLTVEKIYMHPNYSGAWDHDIAIIKLKKPLKFSGGVKSIEIATTLPKNGEETSVTGFGKTISASGGVLRRAILPYMDYETCQPHYIEPDFTPYSFCTSKEGVGPCAYDWGSPLVYKHKLIGIFSGSYECGGVTYPGVYVDVTKYRSWINKIIKRNNHEDENKVRIAEKQSLLKKKS